MGKIVLISILVPIYKVPEKLLRQCIESVMNQTMREIEIILVDDGSPDICGLICDEYAVLDRRIKVIHQDNKGLSGARNTAFYHATGKYIMFLDGDDYIDKRTCEMAYFAAENSNADVVFWDCISEYYRRSIISKTIKGGSRKFENEECLGLQSRVLDFNGKIAQVFAKLIRRELLERNNILHVQELRQGAEGLVFNIVLFEYVNSAFYLAEPLNHYVYNENSITHSYNEENYYLIIKCFMYLKDFIMHSKNQENLEKNFYTRLLYVIISTGISGYFNPQNASSYHEKKQGYKKFLKQPLIAEALKNGNHKALNYQRRIILVLIRLKFWRILQLLAVIRRQELFGGNGGEADGA